MALLGLAGAAAVLTGVRLPWLSTFNHLLSQSGWGTRNGTLLAAGAAVAAGLAVAGLARPSRTLRWLLALTGFAVAGFSGYLLVQLYGALAQLGAMTFASKGPGLYVATAGGLGVFATIFLPMPGAAAPGRDVAAPWGRSWRTTPLGSRVRWPAAALAVVAGLAHVPVTPQHLAEAPYIGVLFLCLTVVCVLGAAALLVADTPLVHALLGSVCLLAALAFVWSRAVGLPLMSDDVGDWGETLGLVAVLAELGVAGLTLRAVRRARTGRTLAHSAA